MGARGAGDRSSVLGRAGDPACRGAGRSVSPVIACKGGKVDEMSRAIQTNLITHDGKTVYDLEPQGGELMAVAGPAGVDPESIDPDAPPDGFRWVEDKEWSELQS